MKTGIGEAFILSLVMAAVIFFCRVFPFLFFRGKTGGGPPSRTADDAANADGGRKASLRVSFLSFVEKIVPPVAMTVLAFNALTGPVKASPRDAIPALAAAVLTALVHLWRRNPLLSIVGGTAAYMILIRVTHMALGAF